MTAALFFISVIFSILAAIMAYLITYQEYRHHFPDKRDIKKAALRTGGFTFLLFLFLVYSNANLKHLSTPFLVLMAV